MKETGAQAIKIEGGSEILESVNQFYQQVFVMGHLGLTPQSIINLAHT